jgi:hypothetical protein
MDESALPPVKAIQWSENSSGATIANSGEDVKDAFGADSTASFPGIDLCPAGKKIKYHGAESGRGSPGKTRRGSGFISGARPGIFHGLEGKEFQS